MIAFTSAIFMANNNPPNWQVIDGVVVLDSLRLLGARSQHMQRHIHFAVQFATVLRDLSAGGGAWGAERTQGSMLGEGGTKKTCDK